MFRLPFAFAVVLVMAGCAGLHGAPRALSPQTLWQDHKFAPVTLAAIDARMLFALAPELQAQIDSSGIRHDSVQRRVDHLMTLLFGRGLNEFSYRSGQSTIAAETWRLKRGNCLSLSVLAHSIGRALDLQMQLQEVAVTPVFDRRGNVDFVGRHVNVLVLDPAGLKRKDGTRASGHVVIDFDPQMGSRHIGTPLTDAAMLARYYGNLGAEYFERSDLALAYAAFKAAILADPSFAPSYSNLAQLYLRKGLSVTSEALLLHAVTLDGDDDTPLRVLQSLMLSQGRQREAQHYAEMLRARRERNPYHWLAQGLELLGNNRNAQAVRALERAQALTSGFDEVHQYLAVAYWRVGNKVDAQRQLATLRALDAARNADQPGAADPVIALLSRKFAAAAESR